jgi:hypothetical protein
MATTVLYPAYDYQRQFTANPAGDNFARVADADDGTLVSASVAAIDRYGLTRPGNDIWVVSAVDLVLRGNLASGTGSVRGTYSLNGTTVNTSTQALSTTMTTYTWSSIARPGGGSWTAYDLAALLAGPEALTGMTGPVQVAGFSLNVTHTVRANYAADGNTAVTTPEEAPSDPVRLTTTLTMAVADYDQATGVGPVVVGQVYLPGVVNPVFVTLCPVTQTVQNPPSY